MKKLLFGLLAVLAVSTAVAGVAPFPNDIFVRGSFNDWGLADVMTYNGEGEYFAEISLDVGDYEFKIANEGWDNPDWGATGDPNVILDVATGIGPASFGNFLLSISESGNYLFRLFDLQTQRGPVPTGGQLIVTQVIPIPAAGLLMLSALGGLGFLRRRH